MIEGKKCSNVVLKTRKIGKWVDVSTDEIFKGKKVILFSLPGAFTPVCSEKQLPGFEENYDKLSSLGINEVYCISVNDGFVMNAWADQQKLRKVKVLPDGNADFSIGFGKEMFGWNDKSGTRWKVCVIPLGGYVKFFGDRNVYSQADNDKIIKEYSKEDQDKLFVLKPLYQRALIVFGGPLANFLLAILIFFSVYIFAG
ncbi:site-2 protease family protein, partial [Candidatus Pelagibacter sp.]|nr:site-2 protease family protein [Candidatus Pelagibacter sp.]